LYIKATKTFKVKSTVIYRYHNRINRLYINYKLDALIIINS